MSDQGSEYPTYPGEGSSEGTPPPPGSAPPPPTGGSPQQPPQRPGSLDTAVRLMQLGAVLSVVSVVVSLLMLDSLKDSIAEAMRDADPNVTQSSIDAAYTVGIVSGVVGGIIGAGLWLWMAWKNGQGRSWARIVATVLGGLGLLSTLVGFASPGMTAVTLGFGLINLILAITILVLLWKKESSEYYNAVSAQGMMR
jgi:hypothetical protein